MNTILLRATLSEIRDPPAQWISTPLFGVEGFGLIGIPDTIIPSDRENYSRMNTILFQSAYSLQPSEPAHPIPYKRFWTGILVDHQSRQKMLRIEWS